MHLRGRKYISKQKRQHFYVLKKRLKRTKYISKQKRQHFHALKKRLRRKSFIQLFAFCTF